MSTHMKVATALVGAQAELRAISKDSVNPHFKNKYASLDGIIDVVRPVLAKHDLAVSQGAEATQDGKALIVHTTLIHSSGETFGNQVFVPIGKQDAQGAGGALTYGRRYGLSALLCLATEEDDDGNTAARQPAKQRSGEQRARPTSSPTNGSADRPTSGTPAATPTNGRAKEPEYKVFRGKALKDYDTPELTKVLKWAREKGQEDLSDAINEVLANRALGEDPDSKANRQVAKAQAAIEKEDATLPF